MAVASVQADARRSLRLREAGWWLLVLAASGVTASLILVSPQLGLTAVLIVLAAGAYARSRVAGTTIVWLTWLVIPEVRRLFGTAAADPLALAPFLATGTIVALEIGRTQLSRRAWVAVALALAGYAIGLPTGLVASAPAALFGLLAAATSVAALVIGYREGTSERLTLQPILALALVPISAFGILQYFDLPSWDRDWIAATNFITATAPEAGRIRAFATLNSPATFALVLSIGVLAYLTQRRLEPLRVAALLVLLTALALTYVRAAWISLAVAMVVLALVGRRELAGRVGVVLAILVVGVGGVAAGTSTGGAVVSRFDTFNSLGSDTSAQERLATPATVFPVVVEHPLGVGIGQAGEASRLAPASAFRNTDSTYLSLLYQLGIVGTVLVLGAQGIGVVAAWGNVRRTDDRRDLFILGVLVLVVVGGLASDLLFGVTGAMAWYVVGAAFGRRSVTG